MKIIRPPSNQPMPDSAKKVFSGILFDVYQWEQKQFDGSVKTFEKLFRNDTVGVIALTPDKKFILTKQEQPGMRPFIGTSGGIVDDNEELYEAAKRELLEETGYESKDWELYEATQPTTKIDWAIFLFIARNCKKVSDPRLDAGEKVKVVELSFDEFIETVKKEEFRDKELALKIFRIISKPNGMEVLRKQLLG